MITVTKAGDALKAYYADATTPIAQVGATQTALGVWAGSLASTTTLLGAASQTPTNPWSGYEAHAMVFTRALTLAEITSIVSVP